jgi:hypothetical protein
MLRDGDRGRRQLGLEYRPDVIDLPPGGDSIGCASRPAAAVAAPALRALICGRAEAPEPSSRHQALVHRSVFDGKVSYSGSRRAIRSALAIIERDREFVDSPLEGGVTSELVSGIRVQGLILAFYSRPYCARTRARGQRRKSRPCRPICRRGELVLENECRSLQVVLMSRRVLLGCGRRKRGRLPGFLRTLASTTSRCGSSSGPS